MNHTISVGMSVAQVSEVHHSYRSALEQRWKNLKKVLSGDNEAYQTDEWRALDEALSPAPVESPVEALPKAIPDSFPDDPPAVVRGKVVKSYLNRRLWGVCILTASGRPGDIRNLWVRQRTLMKVGWTVYAKPNPSTSEEGYVLHGEYNRFGDRLR